MISIEERYARLEGALGKIAYGFASAAEIQTEHDPEEALLIFAGAYDLMQRFAQQALEERKEQHGERENEPYTQGP